MTKRFFYIVLVIVAGIFGYSSRYFSDKLPFIIAEFAGDTFWAFAVYFLIKSIIPKDNNVKTAIFAYVFSVLIEVSQMYHAIWIDKIRNSFIGGLILGFGFHWEDLVCYATGIFLAMLCDYFFIRKEV